MLLCFIVCFKDQQFFRAGLWDLFGEMILSGLFKKFKKKVLFLFIHSDFSIVNFSDAVIIKLLD